MTVHDVRQEFPVLSLDLSSSGGEHYTSVLWQTTHQGTLVDERDPGLLHEHVMGDEGRLPRTLGSKNTRPLNQGIITSKESMRHMKKTAVYSTGGSIRQGPRTRGTL